jgi:hypothetical protein
MRQRVCTGLCVLLAAVSGTGGTPQQGGGEQEPANWPRIDQGPYVGSVKCAECH